MSAMPPLPDQIFIPPPPGAAGSVGSSPIAPAGAGQPAFDPAAPWPSVHATGSWNLPPPNSAPAWAPGPSWPPSPHTGGAWQAQATPAHTPAHSYGTTAYSPFPITPASASAPGGWLTPPHSPSAGFEGADPIAGGGFGVVPGSASTPNFAFPGQALPATHHETGRSRSTRRRRVSTHRANRSTSRNRPEHAGPQLTRSLSHNEPYSPAAFGMHSPYGAPKSRKATKASLAPRPRDWRAGYTSKNLTLPSFLNLHNKAYSLVQEVRDDMQRALHPFLIYSTKMPTLDIDLRYPPFEQENMFPTVGRQPMPSDFMQYATNPPTNFLRLYHKDLPWYVDIQAGTPGGINLGDVILQVYASLANMIRDDHFFTEALTDHDRANLTATFKVRCQNDATEIQGGVRRVDFLGSKVILRGLVKKNGMYEMKLESL